MPDKGMVQTMNVLDRTQRAVPDCKAINIYESRNP
jgi:hypothetical protein